MIDVGNEIRARAMQRAVNDTGRTHPATTAEPAVTVRARSSRALGVGGYGLDNAAWREGVADLAKQIARKDRLVQSTPPRVKNY